MPESVLYPGGKSSISGPKTAGARRGCGVAVAVSVGIGVKVAVAVGGIGVVVWVEVGGRGVAVFVFVGGGVAEGTMVGEGVARSGNSHAASNDATNITYRINFLAFMKCLLFSQ
jgi:hypothetical protein